MRMFVIGVFCFGVGCAAFPELDGTIAPEDQNAPFPRLVPLASLISQATQATQSQITPVSIATLEGRIAALQARANGLRGPVIPASTRTAMRAAARRAALR